MGKEHCSVSRICSICIQRVILFPSNFTRGHSEVKDVCMTVYRASQTNHFARTPITALATMTSMTKADALALPLYPGSSSGGMLGETCTKLQKSSSTGLDADTNAHPILPSAGSSLPSSPNNIVRPPSSPKTTTGPSSPPLQEEEALCWDDVGFQCQFRYTHTFKIEEDVAVESSNKSHQFYIIVQRLNNDRKYKHFAAHSFDLASIMQKPIFIDAEVAVPLHAVSTSWLGEVDPLEHSKRTLVGLMYCSVMTQSDVENDVELPCPGYYEAIATKPSGSPCTPYLPPPQKGGRSIAQKKAQLREQLLHSFRGDSVEEKRTPSSTSVPPQQPTVSHTKTLSDGPIVLPRPPSGGTKSQARPSSAGGPQQQDSADGVKAVLPIVITGKQFLSPSMVLDVCHLQNLVLWSTLQTSQISFPAPSKMASSGFTGTVTVLNSSDALESVLAHYFDLLEQQVGDTENTFCRVSIIGDDHFLSSCLTLCSLHSQQRPVIRHLVFYPLKASPELAANKGELYAFFSSVIVGEDMRSEYCAIWSMSSQNSICQGSGDHTNLVAGNPSSVASKPTTAGEPSASQISSKILAFLIKFHQTATKCLQFPVGSIYLTEAGVLKGTVQQQNEKKGGVGQLTFVKSVILECKAGLDMTWTSLAAPNTSNEMRKDPQIVAVLRVPTTQLQFPSVSPSLPLKAWTSRSLEKGLSLDAKTSVPTVLQTSLYGKEVRRVKVTSKNPASDPIIVTLDGVVYKDAVVGSVIIADGAVPNVQVAAM